MRGVNPGNRFTPNLKILSEAASRRIAAAKDSFVYSQAVLNHSKRIRARSQKIAGGKKSARRR